MGIQKENKLNIWEIPDYSRWYRIDSKIRSFFRKIKWMWQRAKYGYCDMDLWNLDCTLGNYISVTTAELAKRTHGYPGMITAETWDEILNSISDSFYLATNEDAWNNPYEKELFEKEFPFKNKESEEQSILWNNYYSKEMDIQRMREIRKQEGFNLLSEWFFHLWD